jgi:glycosyltransferase involved in cell wall biosynthesis
MIYKFFLLKRQLENLLILPFIWIGKILGSRLIEAKPFDILFIFPFYHTGGAEKVHLQIANAFKGRKGLVLFTKKSSAPIYKQAFIETGLEVIDISRFTDNKIQYWKNLIFRGVVAALVEKQENKPIVFNGQSNFGYKLSRWLDKEIVQVELIHAFCSFSWIRIPFLSFYKKTIMISNRSIAEHKKQYKELGVPDFEANKIIYLPNGISFPTMAERHENASSTINVLYVGRATSEKRVGLIAKIAKRVKEKGLPVEFNMVGDVIHAIPKEYQSFAHFHGPINNEKELFDIYQKNQVLIMASLHEGFPLTIMEAMAAGCVIFSTPVGDIPYHVKQDVNGYLYSSTTDEETIVLESIAYLERILHQPDKCKQISSNNQAYALKEFELSIFEKRYQSLFEQLK